MSRRSARRATALAALAVGCAVSGCPKEPTAPKRPVAQDGLQQRLRAEQLGPTQRLAELAAHGSPEGALRLPRENATVHVGPVAVKLAALSMSHSAGTGKIVVTTPELFLKVSLVTQNVGERPQALDFSFARLRSGEGDYPVAFDAQKAAGSRDLRLEFPVSQRGELVLYFELPRGALAEGAQLLLPAAVGGSQEVTVPLR